MLRFIPRPKAPTERPRSIRVPCTEREFAEYKAAADKKEMQLAAYIRQLIEQDAGIAPEPTAEARAAEELARKRAAWDEKEKARLIALHPKKKKRTP